MATGTITNVLLDPDNDPIEGVIVTARLSRVPVYRVSNSTAVVPPETVTSNNEGEWSITLEATANMTNGAQWVIEQRLPAQYGGAYFTLVNVVAGQTVTIEDAAVSTITPADQLTYYTAAQVDAIIAALDFVADNDPRLTNARTPTAHKISHQIGGSDELTVDVDQLDTTGVPSADTFLNGLGAWAEPPGSGGGAIGSTFFDLSSETPGVIPLNISTLTPQEQGITVFLPGGGTSELQLTMPDASLRGVLVVGVAASDGSSTIILTLDGNQVATSTTGSLLTIAVGVDLGTPSWSLVDAFRFADLAQESDIRFPPHPSTGVNGQVPLVVDGVFSLEHLGISALATPHTTGAALTLPLSTYQIITTDMNLTITDPVEPDDGFVHWTVVEFTNAGTHTITLPAWEWDAGTVPGFTGRVVLLLLYRFGVDPVAFLVAESIS